MIRRVHITGLVLAGGQGSRMGGVDKGLQLHRGVPLALHALRRLTPQVGQVMISANRHLDVYEAFGVPVCRDAALAAGTSPTGSAPVAQGAAGSGLAYVGPLAGFLAGLQRCGTPYLATVPCDAPDFPADLVERLAAALSDANAAIAMAATRGAVGGHAGAAGLQRQPVFCLISTGVTDSLLRFVQGGERQVARWVAGQRCVDVPFDDEAAFANANTLDELARLQPALGTG